uniref:NADH-ubiquinone oxidoreductase chain 5 n=1 Tax=Rana kunyuensis TaxID=359667 RepID=A0A067YPV2_9NEOB|nr:NADH dehydrogenase subunit 5 [Rana kunyuensis]YP_010556282.1 NADH dehydrogenase subunit 5 [Rana coreana]AHG53811.1 NADH dehydrogenase subunit 5 [Rana kunyuensis]UYR96384.1 NADH dehydrogenase subunit 5 [Rana coreana]
MLYPLPLCLAAILAAILMITRALSYARTEHFRVMTTEAVKTSFFLSLLPLYSFYSNSHDASLASSLASRWWESGPMYLHFGLQLDLYTVLFLPIIFLVSWSILEFSSWYMQSDPNIDLFLKYLLIFLLAMILLVCSSNLSLFFIGWEGVGIMSFLLIGWFHTRMDAASAAFQAVLYNRVGDIGFLLSFCWFFKNAQTLDFAHILSLETGHWPLLGFIVAATSKSAQFGFHPWLVAAMEGPTPVSALLHSSTMVVAGIFLLIRIHPLLAQNPLSLTLCLCLGAMSTFSAANKALAQNDIKKIIAYSTSSQLGLMMVAVGLNLPYLAFFHMCTHAFFKAMLFLCSGVIIHALDNEQDIRNMGGLQHALPMTTTCLSLGSFALMGIPFLAGFYSKDAIIEAASSSFVNFMALLLTLVATAFTAVYSMRLIYFASMSEPRMNPILKCNENDKRIMNSLTRLFYGALGGGYFIFKITIPIYPHVHTMPPYMKLTALTVTIFAFIIAYELAKAFWTIIPKSPTSKELDTTFYTPLVNRTVVTVTLDTVKQILDQVLDAFMNKLLGPCPYTFGSKPIELVRVSQKGQIKLYLSAFFLTLFLTVLILKLAT